MGFEAQVQNLAKKVAWCGWQKKCTTVIKDDASGPPPPKFLCPGQLDSNNMGFANTCSNALLVPDVGPMGNDGSDKDFYAIHGNYAVRKHYLHKEDEFKFF